MITEVQIKNYRSIVDAKVKLSPFTLLIGANGTGKSNFLRLFKDMSQIPLHIAMNPAQRSIGFTSFLEKHINHAHNPQEITIHQCDGSIYKILSDSMVGMQHNQLNVNIFSIDPQNIGKSEEIQRDPAVNEQGEGAVSVLDALKTGDREELFQQIEGRVKRYIPEIEKLSFIPGQSTKQLQVREKYIEQPIPLSELSEGTRLVLTILTILHQENPPTLIGLEELDRGLHPRLFQRIIELLFQITQERGVQIIATTHNPYMIDEFIGHEEAVVIVEKEKGETKFTTLAERLEGLDPEKEPLGSLWYSGFVGGVPKLSQRR